MSTPQSLGFRTPTGDDWANTGDNDITVNAQRSAALYDQLVSFIDGATWYRGGLLATDPVNAVLGSIKDGIYRATSDARAAELSLPDGRAGYLTQVSSGDFGMHVYQSLVGTSVRLWSSSGSWGTWRKPANAYTDTAVANVKWYQGGMTAEAPVNDTLGAMKDGDYRITQDVTAAALGLPWGRSGNFKQVSYGTFGFHTHTTILGTAARIWSNDSQVWGDWVLPDAGSAAPVASGGAGSGTKVVPLVLTVGHGGTAYAQTAATVRYPMWWGAGIHRFRVHIRNANPRENTVRTGAVSFPQGLYLGTDSGDGITTDATQIVGAFTTPANGDEWVSGWIQRELLEDSKHLLSAAYVAADTVMNNAGGCWTSPGQIADSSAGTWTQGSMAPFDVWIEAEVPATTPTVAVVGDSLSAGTASTIPVQDSMLSQYMRSSHGLPIHYAHVGDTFNSYNGGGASGSEVYKKTRWSGLARPDSVLLALGSNDIFGGSASLATMKTRIAKTLDEWIKPNLSTTVFLSNITPRDAETGAKEDVRRAYNDWLALQDQPGGIARAVFDFAGAISADNETIIPEYNGDGIHLTTAGYAAEAATLHHLTSPAVVYRT